MGMCTCAMGFAMCGAGCADVTSDPMRCGSCTTVCPGVTNGAGVCTASMCGIRCNAGYMLMAGACVISTAIPVTFPSTTSIRSGPSSGTPGPLGAGGGGTAFQIGDAVEQTFTVRPSSVNAIDVNFTMSDLTSGCAVGMAMSWNVLVNGTVVGSYGWAGGSGVSPRAVMQSYTFAPVAPMMTNQFTLRFVAATTVCSGGSSWNWFPGGTVTFR